MSLTIQICRIYLATSSCESSPSSSRILCTVTPSVYSLSTIPRFGISIPSLAVVDTCLVVRIISHCFCADVLALVLCTMASGWLTKQVIPPEVELLMTHSADRLQHLADLRQPCLRGAEKTPQMNQRSSQPTMHCS